MKMQRAVLTIVMVGAAGLLQTSSGAPPQTGAGSAASVMKSAQRVKAKAKAPAEQKPAAAKKASPEMAKGKAGVRRDPFVSPVREGGVQAMVTCTGGGKRCLQIPELVLRGVVKAPDGFIALVAIPAQGQASERAYFLRANDAVFNGYVLRITGNSIVFKENVIDKLGHVSDHEVVKSIASGPEKGA